MERERERRKGEVVWILAMSIVTSQEGSLEVGKEAKKFVATQFYSWERERKVDREDYYTYVGAMNNVPIVVM